MLWKVEPIWSGRTVVIVAGGPSLSLSQVRLIGQARSSDKIRVISVNDAVYPCWFADIAYACDKDWWKFHGNLPGFAGRKVSLGESIPGVDWLDNTGASGLELNPSGLRAAGNSGYQSLNLCVHLKAKRVLLVGFDMRGDTHWFGNHPDPVRRNTPPKMDRRIERFREIAGKLKSLGMDVANVTAGSAITCFRNADLATELGKTDG